MKKLSLITLLSMFAGIVFSQNDTTIYYSNVDKAINTSEKAFRYEKVTKRADNTFEFAQYYKSVWDKKNNDWQDGTTYFIVKANDSTYTFNYTSTSTKKYYSFTRVFNKLNNGYAIKEYKDNKLASTGFSYLIFPLIKEGKWTYYNAESGKVSKEETYIENQTVSNKRWDESGKELISDVFGFVDILPEFIGGEKEMTKFIVNNLKYPSLAREDGTAGTVYITFIIMEDGSVREPKILRGIGSGCDEESISVVKLMDKKWKPGILNGKAVRVQFNLPLRFSLG